jgi:hypothetical protein
MYVQCAWCIMHTAHSTAQCTLHTVHSHPPPPLHYCSTPLANLLDAWEGQATESRRVATATFWPTCHHNGKISPGWWGWGCTPTSFTVPSHTKLRLQVHFPYLYSTLYGLWGPSLSMQNWLEKRRNLKRSNIRESVSSSKLWDSVHTFAR